MTSSDVDFGKEEVRNLTYEVVGLSNSIGKHIDDVEWNPGFASSLLIPFTSKDQFDNSLAAVRRMIATGELTNDVQEIPSNHPAALQFNKKLKKLLVLKC